MEAQIMNVYNHSIDNGPRLNVKVEKNSRGYNWEVTVTNCPDIGLALRLIQEAESALKAQYDGQPTVLAEGK